MENFIHSSSEWYSVLMLKELIRKDHTMDDFTFSDISLFAYFIVDMTRQSASLDAFETYTKQLQPTDRRFLGDHLAVNDIFQWTINKMLIEWPRFVQTPDEIRRYIRLVLGLGANPLQLTTRPGNSIKETYFSLLLLSMDSLCADRSNKCTIAVIVIVESGLIKLNRAQKEHRMIQTLIGNYAYDWVRRPLDNESYSMRVPLSYARNRLKFLDLCYDRNLYRDLRYWDACDQAIQFIVSGGDQGAYFLLIHVLRSNEKKLLSVDLMRIFWSFIQLHRA